MQSISEANDAILNGSRNRFVLKSQNVMKTTDRIEGLNSFAVKMPNYQER